MKARAAVLFEPGNNLEICDVTVQDPGPGEVRVKMVAAGVCHTDLSVIKGNVPAPMPIVPGHEGAGIVHDVGIGVTSLKPGDHVIPLWRLSCGECELCSGGRPALCAEGSQVRSTGRLLDGTSRFDLDGREILHFCGVSSFADFTVMPQRQLLKIPMDLSLEKAALLGCAVITGVGAVVSSAKVRLGSTVAVFGAGGVGVNIIQGAKLAGARMIIAVDQHSDRLGDAKTFGATHLINASTGDTSAEIRKLTAGIGVDYAFEAIGLKPTIEQAYDCLAKRGVATVVGIPPVGMEITIPSSALVYEERVLTGSLYGSAAPKSDIPKLIDLYLDGQLKLDELLTRSYPLEKINQAYEDMLSGENLRSIVTF